MKKPDRIEIEKGLGFGLYVAYDKDFGELTIAVPFVAIAIRLRKN